MSVKQSLKQVTLKDIMSNYSLGFYSVLELMELIKDLANNTKDTSYPCYYHFTGGYHIAIQGGNVYKIELRAFIEKMD